MIIQMKTEKKQKKNYLKENISTEKEMASWKGKDWDKNWIYLTKKLKEYVNILLCFDSFLYRIGLVWVVRFFIKIHEHKPE